MRVADAKSASGIHTNQRWYRKVRDEIKRFYREDYLPRHTNTKNRRMHSIGTITGILTAGALTATGHWIIGPIALPVVTYTILFAGHKFFEKNKPATLEGWKEALKSVPCDFVMVSTDIAKAIKAGIRTCLRY